MKPVEASQVDRNRPQRGPSHGRLWPSGIALLSLATGFLALCSLGCGSAAGSAPTTTPSLDVEQLKQQVNRLRQQAVMKEVEAEHLAQTVRELRQELDSTKTELASARTALERRAERPEPLKSPNSARQPIEEEELEEEPVAPTPAAFPTETSVPTSVPAPAPVDLVAAQAHYDNGYALFHRKNYQGAETVFADFLRQYPNTDLSDNARFWIGESRYARKDYEGALSAFIETVERHPSGNKVPDALLKAGKTLEALGRRDQAIHTYREVLSRFAGSAAALTAEERLAALGP